MKKKIFSMKSVAPTVAAVLGLPAPAAATEPPIAAIAAELAGSRRLAVLAPDALGILPWRLWKGRMPFLSSLHERRSILLEAVMPSSTCFNFACMLTGADSEAVHGINKPYRRGDKWVDFQCETLYDLVRRAGGKSAGAGQEGYTGEMLLARCADLGWVAAKGPAATVADLLMEQYGREKPMFLIAQFGNVDSALHALGPSNPEIVPMLEELDRTLARLVPFLAAAGAAVILLADHGQHDIADPPPGGKRGGHGKDLPEDRLVPCTWVPARAGRGGADRP